MIDSIRATTASILVFGAPEGTVEQMTRDGWHRSTEVVDERAAVAAIVDRLGAGGVYVNVIKTGAGYIVWTKPPSESCE
ncbi:hypothetical protein [Nevskia soli]|uniref:hypothetical protein n=1 Tax=Nevskia soli TaxID=418856 RepID=UPI0004A74D08|nr:hypothetical protein [Nevskia soli]